MGKGSNVAKAAKARADAAKRASEVRPGGGGSKGMAERLGAGAMNIQCAICRQAFMGSQSTQQLKEHVDSKHPKETMEKCFPGVAK